MKPGAQPKLLHRNREPQIIERCARSFFEMADRVPPRLIEISSFKARI
jgi:hypothetical protein